MNSSINCIGFYRFIENIQNFKIKIKVQKVVFSQLNLSNLLDSEDDAPEEENQKNEKEEENKEQKLQVEGTKSEDCIEKIISWQEKLFSKDEINLYSQHRTFESLIEKKYQSMVQNLTDSDNSLLKIITVIDADLALKGHSNLEKLDKSEMMIIKLHDLENEVVHVLCQIKADVKKGTLIIKPNFNCTNQNCYLLSAQGGLGESKIEYSIENYSLQLSKDERKKKFFLMMKLNSCSKINRLMDLNLPMRIESNAIMFYIFGEIALAKNFSGNIHVEYWIDFPKKWLAFNNEKLFGLTQKCYPNKKKLAYFGSPFVFHLVYSQSDQMSLIESESPKICFRVVSNDYLDKEKTQGFGLMMVPFCSGKFSQTVNTFCPITSNLADALNNYFLGLDFDIEDFEKSNHKPIGLIASHSTGSIQINLNVILQSNKCYTKLDQIKYDNEVFENITTIIAAFRKAKQKILQLKLKHLGESLQ